MTGPVDIDPAKPHAFLSYTRFDDEVLNGDISELRKALEKAVQARTGEPFNIFQDVEDIKLGEAWRKKLDRAIEAAQLFIPILTPSFFKSGFCRDEAGAFLDYEARAGRDDLVLPIYLIDTPKLDDADQRAADDIASRLHERQYADWRELRFKLRHDDTRPRIDELAGAIALAVERSSQAAPTPPPREPTLSADVEDRLAALEARLEERDQAIAAERSKRELAEAALADEKTKTRELAEAASPFEGQVEEAKKRETTLRNEIKSLQTQLAERDGKSVKQQLAKAEAALEKERERLEKIKRHPLGIPPALLVGGTALALVIGVSVVGWMAGRGGSSSSDIELLRRQNQELAAKLAESEHVAAEKESELREVQQALTGAGNALEGERTASVVASPMAEKNASDNAYEPLSTFRDCNTCPEMVVIPAGSFFMGARESEPDSPDNERPRHKVNVESFAIGKYEVTFDEWHACIVAEGCDHDPDDDGWGRGKLPVINVSWKDAQQYVAWLSSKTGEPYRLPSEAEWEYAARAFPVSQGLDVTAYAFGDTITKEQANFNKNIGKTVDVGTYPPNAWGLHDMHGNVWEWVEDGWHDDYDGAPTDGRAWTEGNDSYQVLRGGSWNNEPRNLRSANRYRYVPDFRNYDFGFRVARTLTP